MNEVSAKAKKDTNAKKNKKTKKSKKGLFNRFLFKLVGASALICCVALIFTIRMDYNEKSEELESIQAKIDECVLENAELERVLANDELFLTYMERVAREHDYAYPDERQFYDTSRNGSTSNDHSLY